MSSFVPSAITQPFFELRTPDFAWKFVWTVPTNYEIFFGQGCLKRGSQGRQGVTQPFFELQTPDFAWNFVWTVSTNYEIFFWSGVSVPLLSKLLLLPLFLLLLLLLYSKLKIIKSRQSVWYDLPFGLANKLLVLLLFLISLLLCYYYYLSVYNFYCCYYYYYY